MEEVGRTQRPLNSTNRVSVGILAAGFVLAVGASYFAWETWQLWTHRPTRNVHVENSNYWKISASNLFQQHVHIRFQDTGFWIPVRSHLLSKGAHITTQKSGTRLFEIQTGAQILLSADSALFFSPVDSKTRGATAYLLAGMAQVRGPLHLRSKSQQYFIGEDETKTFFVEADAIMMEPRAIEQLETQSELDLSKSPYLEIKLKAPPNNSMNLEFSRDSSFQSILFTEPIMPRQSLARVYMGDRSKGAWFVRLRESNKSPGVTLAVANVQVYERLEPSKIVRRDHRWISWSDSGPSSFYRVETSLQPDFNAIMSSFNSRDRFFDLSRIDYSGQIYLRVVGVSPLEKEYFGPGYAFDLPSRRELLTAKADTVNPELKLFSRGWRIQLNESEALRIREGYVILRESELRGIRVAPELDARVRQNPENYVFEISKDIRFSNPERVRPTANGELLPPALPLGVIYTRLREVGSNSQFGAAGPTSRISTFLPAPTALQSQQKDNELRLAWSQPIDVAGFEVKISASKDFPEATTVVHRTTGRSKTLPLPDSDRLFWTVTALHEGGGAISLPTSVQTASIQRTRKLSRTIKEVPKTTSLEETRRSLAAVNPSLVELIEPLEDAVIVGEATKTRFADLVWKDVDPVPGKRKQYEIEISTDRDFVQIVERGSTAQSRYALEGDLPEGSLFWRVRDKSNREWSSARRLELIFE